MQFVDPPVRDRGKRGPGSKWVEIVKTLKGNPNSWGLTGSYCRAIPTHIRKGRYPAFIPAGVTDLNGYMDEHWEIHADHTKGSNKCDVYIRWIGEGCSCEAC